MLLATVCDSVHGWAFKIDNWTKFFIICHRDRSVQGHHITIDSADRSISNIIWVRWTELWRTPLDAIRNHDNPKWGAGYFISSRGDCFWSLCVSVRNQSSHTLIIRLPFWPALTTSITVIVINSTARDRIRKRYVRGAAFESIPADRSVRTFLPANMTLIGFHTDLSCYIYSNRSILPSFRWSTPSMLKARSRTSSYSPTSCDHRDKQSA